MADEICKDVFINFLSYFADLQRRMFWFMARENGSLSPLGDDTWEFREAGFQNFAAEFFLASGFRWLIKRSERHWRNAITWGSLMRLIRRSTGRSAKWGGRWYGRRRVVNTSVMYKA